MMCKKNNYRFKNSLYVIHEKKKKLKVINLHEKVKWIYDREDNLILLNKKLLSLGQTIVV